jgi:hypothetical protein
MSTDQFYKGMSVVGEEIASALVSHGIANVNFQWDHPLFAPDGPPPASVELAASTSSRNVVRMLFSREQLEDSADRIDRPDVWAMVRNVAAQLVTRQAG